jgi:hypothetical protein
MDISGDGWQRLRWGVGGTVLARPQTGTCPSGFVTSGGLCVISGHPVDSLSIVFDEGQDAPGAPDEFGLAVLDNIDVNGTLVGRGPSQPEENDRDEGQGDDNEGDHAAFHDSPSRPETSNVSFMDPAGVKVQSLNGARSVTYNGACVTLVGDALLNGKPGYLLTFAACNLPVLGGIGNLSITVTGPAGVVYQKATTLVSGSMLIHPH